MTGLETALTAALAAETAAIVAYAVTLNRVSVHLQNQAEEARERRHAQEFVEVPREVAERAFVRPSAQGAAPRGQQASVGPYL